MNNTIADNSIFPGETQEIIQHYFCMKSKARLLPLTLSFVIRPYFLLWPQ